MATRLIDRTTIAEPTSTTSHPGFGPRGAAFFEGKFVAIEDATVSIATHAFNYGTGCFEGIRGYWNEGHGELYLLKLVEHCERLARNARVLHIELPMSPQELARMTVELVHLNGYREDVYIRPLAYKSSPLIRVGLLGLADAFACFTAPMGDYHDTQRGLAVTVSGWRRNGDNAIPPRLKATGGYLNAALAVADAQAAGYDEAIMLTADGRVSEASAANLFLVIAGTLVTPDRTSDILPGLTRDVVIDLAGRLGIPVQERRIDRTELLTADEAFLCGTGVQIAPVTSVDGRSIGTGEVGELTRSIQDRYVRAVHGDIPDYMHWLTPVYDDSL
jgi:branched-chain amino acid aminotransferase